MRVSKLIFKWKSTQNLFKISFEGIHAVEVMLQFVFRIHDFYGVTIPKERYAWKYQIIH